MGSTRKELLNILTSNSLISYTAMAKKNPLSEIFGSENILPQLLLGVFIFIIARIANATLPLSIFLGVLGACALGWFTSANENNPQSSTVASNDGIDAGLKYWLFFMLACLFLGYSTLTSILFGAIAGIGGGITIAWWRSKETTSTQISKDVLKLDEETDEPRTRVKRSRKKFPRYRRASGSFNLRFWERS